MTIDMDGLRARMADAYKSAITGYNELSCGEDCSDKPGFDKLKTGLDDLHTYIGAIMCLYSDDPADLCSNMTEEAFKLPFIGQEKKDGN